MAKKKKKSASKKAQTEKTFSPFWRQVHAFLILVFALFLAAGGFGMGGSLPTGAFEKLSWLVGFGAYFVPVVVIYLSIQKFKDEEHKIPFAKLTSSIFLLTMLAAMLHIFVEKDLSKEVAAAGENGGQIGYAISNFLLGFLSPMGGFIFLIVLVTIGFLFTFSIAPKTFLSWFIRPFRRRPRKIEGETDLGKLKQKAEAVEFKINEQVPVDHGEKPVPKLASLKNTAQKLTPSENHEALTTASDPKWEFPSIELLNRQQDKADPGNVEEKRKIIEETLANFNMQIEMEGANIGPRVTQYTLRPPTGVKLSKITALESNIALDLAAESIRIEAPIPGKRAVGIEVPNKKAATVRLASVMQSREWKEVKSPLSFAVGKDISGQSVVAALDKMPHLLIAGATGSGKSVMINILLTSLLYRSSPSDLKLILVDPKQVELTPYNDIPHLLTPVITDPEKTISALKWAVAEMERRLRTFAEVSKRNIHEYNALKNEQGMPYIVVVIDELADLMMVAARDVESLIVRLAQKARAAGIHLVLATQRPSVDVITGLIKANVPARIAFTVSSGVDSKTIIDGVGAEKLLGMGDMLFQTSDMPKPKRIQGALITDAETMQVTDFLRMQRPPQYDDEVVSQPVQIGGKGGVVAEIDATDQPIYHDAVKVVLESRKASTSLLQRRLGIGYGRAARLIDTMEEQGIISGGSGSKPRDVLINSLDEVFGSTQGSDASGGRKIEVYDDMPDD